MDPGEWVQALHADGDRVATVAIPRAAPAGGEERPKVEQRVWPAATARSDRVLAWLRHMNARKHDIFLGQNPLRPGARSRFKTDVLEVARCWDPDYFTAIFLTLFRHDSATCARNESPSPIRCIPDSFRSCRNRPEVRGACALRPGETCRPSPGRGPESRWKRLHHSSLRVRGPSPAW